MQLLNLVLLVVACVVVAYAAPPNIGGCPIFPASFEYNKPIETYEVDPLNTCYLNRIISNAPTPYLRLDMGNDLANGYGIPYSSGAPVSIDLDLSNGYFSESDCLNASNPTQLSRPCCEYGASLCNGKWAAPYATEIESQSPSNPNPTSGDRHTSYIDTTNCLLYETFATAREGGTTWSASSSAVYDLNVGTFPQRPAGWTSADAAGLPILPGLMKYSEFSSGTVDHALRFTAEVAQMAYVSPASHLGGSTNAYDLPYGIRLRLKADFNATGYSAQGQVLIATLKKYGMFFADQGTGFYISGTSDTNWDNAFFDEINQESAGKRIHIDNFEVVQMPTAVYYGYSAGSVTCTQSPNSSPATSLTSNSIAGQVKDILLN